MFGFSLAQSRARAKGRRLFEGYEFWVSPLTKHKEVIEELILAAGGLLLRERPLSKDAVQVRVSRDTLWLRSCRSLKNCFISPTLCHATDACDSSLLRLFQIFAPILAPGFQVRPKHLIICHEDDSNLVYYLTKTINGSRGESPFFTFL